MTRKLLLNDGRTERELLLTGTLVVGRDPSCDISDLDPLLSRRHAEFVSNAQGLIVRDLGSRNGILVNGVKVPERKLASGDVVQLGHLHLRYVEDVPPPPAQVKQAEETTATALEAATMLPSALREATGGAGRPATPAAGPLDVTMAPGSARAAAPTDATMAPGTASPAGPDLDVTMAPGAARSAAPADVTMAPGTTGRAAAGMDVTMAPGTTGQAPPGLDVTMAPGASRAEAPAGAARLMVNANLVVVEATPACRGLLGVSPESLIGGPVTDALMLALRAVANGSGASPLSIVTARTTPGGPMTVTFRAGQASETV